MGRGKANRYLKSNSYGGDGLRPRRAAERSRPPGKTRRREVARQPVDDRWRIEKPGQRGTGVIAPRRVERHQPGERARGGFTVSLRGGGQRPREEAEREGIVGDLVGVEDCAGDVAAQIF